MSNIFKTCAECGKTIDNIDTHCCILPKPTNKVLIKKIAVKETVFKKMPIKEENALVILKDIVSSKEQTKNWRKSQTWYKTGKGNECEIYQRDNLEKFFKKSILKTNFRFNTRTNELKEISCPMKKADGFDYTEDFDGILKETNKTLLFNLKFVCDAGGAQTRTLREVYHFIGAQLEYLVLNRDSTLYFINILEGNTSFNNRNKFNFLVNLEKYKEVKDKVFVGDFLEFMGFYNSNIKVRDL